MNRVNKKNILIVGLMIFVLVLSGISIYHGLSNKKDDNVVNNGGNDNTDSNGNKDDVNNSNNSVDDNENDSNVDNSTIESNSSNMIVEINNANITNDEIKSLYNQVRKKDYSAMPKYDEKSLLNSRSEELLNIASLVMEYNGEVKHLNENVEFADKMTQESAFDLCGIGEIHDCLIHGQMYLDVYDVKNKVKELFNKDINIDSLNDFKTTCFGYYYNKDLKIMYKFDRCGPGEPEGREVVYKYEEADNEINVYTAIAHSSFEGTFTSNSKKEYDSSFELNNDNYKDFNHLKYTFKKN